MKRNPKQYAKAEFCINNKMVSDAEDIANGFNDYFINIGASLADKIHSTSQYNDYLQNPVTTRFSFRPVNDITIKHNINKLKNKLSYVHDAI